MATQKLGLSPKLPKKVLPNGKTTDGQFDFRFVTSEDEKSKNDYEYMKLLAYHYEWIGRQQINRYRDEIGKKYNLANGVIDPNDYIPDDSSYKEELEMLDGSPLDFDLKFYPLAPNIVRNLKNHLSRSRVNYSAMAVNPEATNAIIEEKNNMLRQILLEPLHQQFMAGLDEQGITQEEQPDVFEQQEQMFYKLPQVQKYMSKEYRLDVETWANHTIQHDNRRFKMREVEKESFVKRIVTDMPYTHINLLDSDYTVENIDERYAAYLRSPHSEDVSEAIMFMWFEYESPLNLITRLGHKMNDDDIEKLKQLHIHYRTLLTNETRERYNLDVPGDLAAAQNFLAFKEIGQNSGKNDRYRGGEYKERLVEVCNMYMQVPRKLQRLTIHDGSDKFSTIVDEDYKIKIKPIYDAKTAKDEDATTLVYGEHLEPFYINELWRVIKINLTVNPNPDNSDDIWVTLEKFPIQLSRPDMRFGSYIPIHGGPTTNKYNIPISVVDMIKPWQVFYNYIWNRNDQQLKAEIGKFYAFNQNLIPQESMGEDWGSHNLLKYLLTARDTMMGPLDPSMNNMGGNNLALSGGYGQIVDLTVIDDVIKKAQLAEVIKNECLYQIGISPQFQGDIKPSETATGAQAGINQSMHMLKDLYESHFTMFENVRQTMLEFAKYIDTKVGNPNKMYINDEGERVIFTIPNDLMIHQMGVFTTSSLDDNMLIEDMRQLTLFDNTLGADLREKYSVLSAKSSSEIHSKLKDIELRKQIDAEKEHQRQMEQQQQIINAQTEQVDKKLAWDAEQARLDRESEERIAEIRAYGAANLSEGATVADILKLRELQNKERDSIRQNLTQISNNRAARAAETEKLMQSNNLDMKKIDLEKEKLQVQKDKNLVDLKKAENDLLIAKENKNKYDTKGKSK